jgi:hypothetical protein
MLFRDHNTVIYNVECPTLLGQQQDQDDHQHVYVALVQVTQDLQTAGHHPQVKLIY